MQKCIHDLQVFKKITEVQTVPNLSFEFRYLAKISRGPKLEGCAFANFVNSSGTEGEPSQKREKNGGKKKKINAAATVNRTRDLSITDQMNVLTNQAPLKIQYSLDTDLTKSSH